MLNYLRKASNMLSVLNGTWMGGLLVMGAMCSPIAVQAQPFLGEVICGGWNFCPNGWGECNGQQVSIAENDALFNLIGTTYGGDGVNTFALPNIQGRTVVHQGQANGGSTRVMGEMGGAETVTLTTNQIPSHSHPMVAHDGAEKSASPTNKIMGVSPATAPVFTTPVLDATLKSAAVSSVGGSQPHNNLQPYVAVKCCISLFGIFPSQ